VAATRFDSFGHRENGQIILLEFFYILHSFSSLCSKLHTFIRSYFVSVFVFIAYSVSSPFLILIFSFHLITFSQKNALFSLFIFSFRSC